MEPTNPNPHTQMNITRLLKEWNQLNKSDNNNIYHLAPSNDQDFTHWQCTLNGPTNSIYKGYTFNLTIDIPQDYPMSPPQVHFNPYSMPHANVDWQTGLVCLDVLKQMWSPIFNLQYVVECCVRLLNEPNGDSPLNLELGILLRLGDFNGYNQLIDYYLNHYKHI